DVVVQRHRPDLELLSQLSHRERLEPVLIGQLERRGSDLGPGQPRLASLRLGPQPDGIGRLLRHSYTVPFRARFVGRMYFPYVVRKRRRAMVAETDVLVVGAGPTGLTLAIELQRRGIRHRVIEATAGGLNGSRGKGLQPRTQEVFELLGVLDAVTES